MFIEAKSERNVMNLRVAARRNKTNQKVGGGGYRANDNARELSAATKKGDRGIERRNRSLDGRRGRSLDRTQRVREKEEKKKRGAAPCDEITKV